ncbi:MAG: hypothetical protein LBP62_02820 [Clostridiales bacterium]|jgi:hypothetical protein|nr:hypothetical protein [Clostridiales bacterium]
MGLFGKKPGGAAIDEFWSFFKKISPDITGGFSDNASISRVLQAVDAALSKICPKYAGRFEFEFGLHQNGSKYEFYFFHLRKPTLAALARALKRRMPESLKAKWNFIIGA